MSNANRNVSAITKPHKQKYSIIIPSAGEGTRMKSYGPKSLIKIGDKSILERQLENIHATFIQHEVILVTGFEHDKIKKAAPKNVTIVENKSYKETNVVFSLAKGLIKAKTNKILVIYGDLFFNKEAIQLPLMNESLITIDPSNLMKDDEVGCIVEQNELVHMMYGLPQKWGQVLFLTGKELRLFKELVTSKDCSRYFGFEIINEIIHYGGKFRVFTPKGGKSIDIDSSKDINRANKLCVQ